jgi:hypothetical protein
MAVIDGSALEFDGDPDNLLTMMGLLDRKGIPWAEYQEDVPSSGFSVFDSAKQQDTLHDDILNQDSQVLHDSVLSQDPEMVWMFVASVIVLLLVPAICLLSSGASNCPSSFTIFCLNFAITVLIGLQVC